MTNNKFFNYKSTYIMLVLLILLSCLFSKNMLSSLFYGGILDHNLIVYFGLGAFIYLLNNTFSHKHKEIISVMLSLPLFMTSLAFLSLYINKLWNYVNWAFLTSMSTVSVFIIFFYVLDKKNNKIFRSIALITSVIALALSLTGEITGLLPQGIKNNISGPILSHYNLSYNDLRPDLTTSWNMLKDTFINNIFIGVGPNQFFSIWLENRPTSVMATQYYNYNPDQPASTFYKLSMEIGLAALLIIMIAIFKIKELIACIRENSGSSLMRNKNLAHIVSIIVATLLIVFVSNSFLFFIYYMLLITVPVENKKLDLNKFDKLKSNIAFIILFISLILIFCKYLSYKNTENAIIKFNNDKDYNKLYESLDKAGKIYTNQYIDKIKTKGYLQQAYDVYNNQDKSKNNETIKRDLKVLLDKALISSNKYIYKNINNPDAYVLRANVYQSYLVLATGTNYTLASNDYNKALKLDPRNPDTMLALARLEYFKGERENTANLIDKTLILKYDYMPAYLTLADILESEGKTDKKIMVLEEALKSDLTNQNTAYALAREYSRVGRWQEYNIIMGKLIELNPSLEALKNELNQAKELQKTFSSIPTKSSDGNIKANSKK